MNKTVVSSIIVLLVLQGCSSTRQQLRVGDHYTPATVVYKAADDHVNQAAQARLAEIFASANAREQRNALLPALTICGPYLWAKLKDHPSVASIPAGRMSYQIPQVTNGIVVRIDELEGKLCQRKNEVEGLWDAIVDRLNPDANHSIRKLNDNEKRLFWATVPFKTITEPVFMIEGSGYKLLVNMVKQNDIYVPFWIDDFENLN